LARPTCGAPHPPPHLHAVYQGEQVQINIETLAVMNGTMHQPMTGAELERDSPMALREKRQEEPVRRARTDAFSLSGATGRRGRDRHGAGKTEGRLCVSAP
jgi:hypothetical protein